MWNQGKHLASAIITLVDPNGTHGFGTAGGLDIYSVSADDVTAIDEQIRQADHQWRKAGALRVNEAQLEHLRQVLETRQAEYKYALAQSRNSFRLRHLRAVHRFVRTGLPRFGKAAVMGYATAILCGLSLLLSPLLFSSLQGALGGAFLFTALMSGLLNVTLLVLWPTEIRRITYLQLERQRRDAEEQVYDLRSSLAQAKSEYEKAQQCFATGKRVDDIRRRRGELVALLGSAKYQLLHSDWRLMRGVDFEQFLHRVFEMLGYQVRTTKASGDQGADLLVTGKGKLIAVQAKGYEKSVGNHSVMEANAGMLFYRCDSCVVITNSYFTRHAKQLAQANGCELVDGSQIPDLIEGRIY
jgi:hypothetical protein